jgi:ABC-type transport system involved in cytochrome c biogenesis permease subunit
MNRILLSKNFLSGLLLALAGIAFAYFGTEYRIGTPGSMGPGFLPVLLGCMLAVLGGIVIVGALINPGPQVEEFPLRPLIILTIGVVLFGLLLKTIGLFLGLVMLTVVSGLAGREFKLGFSLILGAAIAAASSLLFVQALGLNVPIWGSLFRF